MKRALPLLAALWACSLRAPRVETTPCTTTTQCDRPDVCFLGECRGHSSALTIVSADVRPPSDAVLAPQQFGGIDLHQSVVHDFLLLAPLPATGTVRQEQDTTAAAVAVADAVVTFSQRTPAIADRIDQVVVRTDASGTYTGRVPQGTWDVLIQPPAPLPPFRSAQPLVTSAPALDFVLPRVGSLVRFEAALTANGAPVGGARVGALDPSGNTLSSPATTQADGGFSMYLPPGTSTYTLQVGPQSDLDGGVAAASTDPLPNYDRLAPASVLDVALPPVATLHGMVSDAQGAPVAGARVYAQSDGMPWSLARSTTTATDGTYALTLRAGDYVVEAAPVATTEAPGVSGETHVTVTAAGASLNLTCPAKVRAFGLIIKPSGGSIGANAQISATRLADRLLTARTASTTATDSGGIWHIVADPGRYRIEVVPAADSGLPRKIVQMELVAPTTAVEIPLTTIQLSPPLLVGGTVRDPKGVVVGGATVNFYGLDANGHSFLLGSSPTDAKGQYKAILPDVPQPGALQAGSLEREPGPR